MSAPLSSHYWPLEGKPGFPQGSHLCKCFLGVPKFFWVVWVGGTTKTTSTGTTATTSSTIPSKIFPCPNVIAYSKYITGWSFHLLDYCHSLICALCEFARQCFALANVYPTSRDVGHSRKHGSRGGTSAQRRLSPTFPEIPAEMDMEPFR